MKLKTKQTKNTITMMQFRTHKQYCYYFISKLYYIIDNRNQVNTLLQKYIHHLDNAL